MFYWLSFGFTSGPGWDWRGELLPPSSTTSQASSYALQLYCRPLPATLLLDTLQGFLSGICSGHNTVGVLEEARGVPVSAGQEGSGQTQVRAKTGRCTDRRSHQACRLCSAEGRGGVSYPSYLHAFAPAYAIYLYTDNTHWRYLYN